MCMNFLLCACWFSAPIKNTSHIPAPRGEKMASWMQFGIWDRLFLSHLCPRPHVSLTDEDECATGRHRCSRHSRCVNTDGSYTCQCESDYVGDGFSCSRRKNGRSQNGMYFQYKLSKRSRTTDTGWWKRHREGLQLCSRWQERSVKRLLAPDVCFLVCDF